MNEKLPTEPGIHQYPVAERYRITGDKKRDFWILGMIGILIVATFMYAAWTWGLPNAAIQYAPSDVVYEKPIQAVHNMVSTHRFKTVGPSYINSTSAPNIVLSEQYYDFGVVNPKQVLSRTFIIANSGQSPLVILETYTTCGCTVADFSASEIPPGKVALMTLRFDSGYHDMRGTTVRRGVVMETNDPDHPSQEIWVQASVR